MPPPRVAKTAPRRPNMPIKTKLRKIFTDAAQILAKAIFFVFLTSPMPGAKMYIFKTTIAKASQARSKWASKKSDPTRIERISFENAARKAIAGNINIKKNLKISAMF